jgi:TetR/AcrR family fatty acid metabolism transcriptional regulator
MERTQELVLDSAHRCFSRYGYRKTSMDDVAAEAGVAKGTVYLYCNNKADLFVRAVESELRAWLEDLSSIVDSDRPANEILVEMARRDAAFVEERPLVADLLSGMLDGHDSGSRSRFAELRHIGLQHVVAVLKLGIRQGVFAADLDVEATARVLQEMQVAGAVLRHRSQLTLRQVRRQQDAAMRLVLRGLEHR